MTRITPHVLVVDDRLDKLLAIEVVLDRMDLMLFKARSGGEALKMCEQSEFAVIILDVNMPGMHGFETAERIRKLRRNARTPIIFVSAAETPELITQGYALGAVDYIQNLIPEILRTKVSVFVDLFRQRAELIQRDEIEAELRAAKLAAEEARKAAEQANAAKDRFIAALSHELRTPLTPVIALLPALLEDGSLPQDVQADLRMIYRSVQLETHLINDLLDITSITRGHFPMNLKVCDLHRTALHALRVVASDSKAKSQHLHVELAAGKHYVWADPARLQQVLWNLLKNAIRYTPEGGEVWLRSKNVDGALQVQITDTGIGFTPEQGARLFTAFERPSGEDGMFKFGGLGLGLFISAAILRQHGSDLRAASPGTGLGAVFEFQMATRENGVKSADEIRMQDRRSFRLLLVEDDENTRNVLSRLLIKRGHEVKTADTLYQALQLAETHRFDLIISDLGLPDGSGLDLMPELRSRFGLRGIAVTGYGTEGDAEKSKSAGFSAHLIKPVDFSMLEQTVQQLAQSCRDCG